MRRLPIFPILFAWLLLAACSSAPPSVVTTAGEKPSATTVANPATVASESAVNELENFDPSNFDASTTIDNQWMPLKPGTRFIYEGTTVEDDGTVVPHRIEINVTDLTKRIGNVRALATWDLDYTDDELVEAELAFYAQDKAGNVWRMGEYPEEYDAGQIVAAPTWIHGFADARAGIHMPAEPALGTPSYAQGWGPAVDWTDRGQVDAMGQQICVPVACYENVLVIAETSATEMDAFQLKSYAPGVGNVHVGWRGDGEKTQEVLELVELMQLSPEEMAEVRTNALALEQSAYAQSKDVYAQTPPAEPLGATPTEPEVAQPAGSAPEVVVYTADLPESALSEFEVWDDPNAPGGKMVGIPNTGDELDPPPEDDPHVTFSVPVQADVAYRCWIHMKVGAPKGKSQANMIWVQFSDAVDQAKQAVFQPSTNSYLTAQGPTQEGWTWAECALAAPLAADSLVRFGSSGEATVRLQAGMEGVGFDQFLLSPAQFLAQAPTDAVVEK